MRSSAKLFGLIELIKFEILGGGRSVKTKISYKTIQTIKISMQFQNTIDKVWQSNPNFLFHYGNSHLIPSRIHASPFKNS